MTTELEQEFFKTFGIEPMMLCDCEFKNLYDYRIEYGQDVCIHTESKTKNPCLKCKLAKQTHPLYPEITAEKLLELVCLLATVIRLFKIPPKLNAESLKYHILRICINEKEGIETRVRALFGGEE